MSVNIKLEEVVKDNTERTVVFSDTVSIEEYNFLRVENEDLQILLSCSNKTCEDQNSAIAELEEKINEMSKSIEDLEQENLSLKKINEEYSNMISEKCSYLNIIYNTVSDLDKDEKGKQQTVDDPKSVISKLDQYQKATKDLKSQVTDNKILIMSICKILSCEYYKIIQKMKDIIQENESNKNKYKIHDQFYQRLVSLTNGVTQDLHRAGCKNIPSIECQGNSDLHENRSSHYEDWLRRMNDYRCPKATYRGKSWQSPTFTPMRSMELNRVPQSLMSIPTSQPSTSNQHFNHAPKLEPPHFAMTMVLPSVPYQTSFRQNAVARTGVPNSYINRRSPPPYNNRKRPHEKDAGFPDQNCSKNLFLTDYKNRNSFSSNEDCYNW